LFFGHDLTLPQPDLPVQKKSKKIFTKSFDGFLVFCHGVFMLKPRPLKIIIQNLRAGGVPAIVGTNKERINAHNYASAMGYLISTRKRIGAKGFEIYRTK